MIYLGDIGISEIYLGSLNISKIYKGDQLIFYLGEEPEFILHNNLVLYKTNDGKISSDYPSNNIYYSKKGFGVITTSGSFSGSASNDLFYTELTFSDTISSISVYDMCIFLLNITKNISNISSDGIYCKHINIDPENIYFKADSDFLYSYDLTKIYGVLNSWARIKDIEIPNGVTEISIPSNYCNVLSIPQSVTYVKKSSPCILDNLPSSILKMDIYAFLDSTFSNIYISNSCQLNDLSFYNAFIGSIEVLSGHPTYDSRDNCNCLIKTSTNTLIRGSFNTTFIPNAITQIPRNAFWGQSVQKLSIGNNITSIDQYAICTNSRLITLELSDTTTASINNNAFSRVVNLKYNGNKSGAPWGAQHTNLPEDEYGVYEDLDKTILIAGYASPGAHIVLPNRITQIYEKAYNNNINLVSITFPEGLTDLPNYVCSGCVNLESVTLPDSLVKLGANAFLKCVKLSTITIGKNVTWLGNLYKSNYLWIFADCNNLSQIIVDPENTVYDSRNDCNAIIETARNKLILGCKNTIIPNTVTEIGNAAFKHCNNLQTISIPDSVTSIGEGAFDMCRNLTSISISDYVTSTSDIFHAYGSAYESYCSVSEPVKNSTILFKCGANLLNSVSYDVPVGIETIAHYAFGNNLFIQNINISNTVKNIGVLAFCGCYSLQSITIPDTVLTLGSEAFYACKGLRSVEIGSGITTLNSYIFNGCPSLDTVTLSVGLSSISDYCFYYCENLVNVNYTGTKAQWNSINKTSNWKYECPNLTTVHCSDGDITL